LNKKVDPDAPVQEVEGGKLPGILANLLKNKDENGKVKLPGILANL
jgi:hypothetical protein